MPSVPGSAGSSRPWSADDWLIREAEAYVQAQDIIGLIECAVAHWRVDGWTVGQFLALIAKLGPRATKVMEKGWNFLGDRSL
jgi:hypothetical protein